MEDTEVIRKAGRVPMVMDVDTFAVQNVYEVDHGVEPGRRVALLDIGARAVNINVLCGNQSSDEERGRPDCRHGSG